MRNPFTGKRFRAQGLAERTRNPTCESVLPSCLNAASWPSRLRCRVSAATHAAQDCQAERRHTGADSAGPAACRSTRRSTPETPAARGSATCKRARLSGLRSRGTRTPKRRATSSRMSSSSTFWSRTSGITCSRASAAWACWCSGWRTRACGASTRCAPVVLCPCLAVLLPCDCDRRDGA